MNGVQFVQLYVMKSAEKIDELYIRKEQGITILPIIKQTPRKIIKTAELFLVKKKFQMFLLLLQKTFIHLM